MAILLIEDDVKIAQSIIEGLAQNQFQCVHAATAEDGLCLAKTTNFRLIIADLMLPQMDGLEMIACLRRDKIKTPVLILSAKRSLDDRVTGLQKGGDDYMVKPFAFIELLARVNNLIRLTAQIPQTATILTFQELTMNLITREVHRNNQKLDLQAKEFFLLELFLKNKDKPLTKVQILEEIWGYSFDPGTNVVDVLVYRLRNKIDKNFSVNYLHTIRGIGYVFKVE